MKKFITLSIVLLMSIACGSKNQASSDSTSGQSQTVNHTNGITNVTGTTNLSAFRTKVQNGEFKEVTSNSLRFTFNSSNYQFSRELKDKTNIIRSSSDLDQAGSTPAEVRNFLISIIDRAGNRAQPADYQGKAWVFQVDDKTMYKIDLNMPLAANPVQKQVVSTKTNSYLAGFINVSSSDVNEFYYITGAFDLTQTYSW